MKALGWIVAGVGVGLAALLVLNQNGGPQYATGNDDLDDAADQASLWGAKQRATGTGGSVLGRIKEGVGNVTGNDRLAGEGLGDQVVGGLKDTAGQAASAVGDAVRGLNR